MIYAKIVICLHFLHYVCILTCYMIGKDFDTYIEINTPIGTPLKPFTFLVRGVLRDPYGLFWLRMIHIV